MNDRCTDHRFRQKLHLYELGVLEDTEREAFEEHLLECTACFEQVQKFQQAARLMKANGEVRRQIASLAEKETTAARDGGLRWPARLRWSTVISTVTVFVVVVVALVVVDWQFEFSPRHEVEAAANSVAVMYFDNLAEPDDPGRLGEICANLLITDLAESQYMGVVSSQRLHDILRSLGQPDVTRFDRDLATEVAVRAKARFMLLGSILQVTPQFVVSFQLVELPDGQVVASQRFSGQEGQDIFSVVDSLTVMIKGNLGLPSGALKERDRSVADVTTKSLTAYRYYIEGVRYQEQFYSRQAIESYHRALEHDSTFAMVYYHLSELEDTDYITLAAKYADGADLRNRLYIGSRKAFLLGDNPGAIASLQLLVERYPQDKDAFILLGRFSRGQGNDREAIAYLNKALAIDSLCKTAYNQLAYAYRAVGDMEHAYQAINKYISIVPDEANPYDSRGDLYAFGGRLDDAIDSYRQAVTIKPDFVASLKKLGQMYVFKRDYARADSLYVVLKNWNLDHVRANARLLELGISLHRGRLLETLEQGDENIDRDIADGFEVGLGLKHRVKFLIYATLDDWEKAQSEAEAAIDIMAKVLPNDKVSYRDIYVLALAKNGRLDAAQKVLDELKSDLHRGHHPLDLYYYIDGLRRWAAGNTSKAAELMDRFIKAGGGNDRADYVYLTGRVYLDAGRLADAVKMFEKFLSGYDCNRLHFGTYNVEAHYYLGIAYEESRWLDRAAEQYEQFLDLWADADVDLPTISDARERLDRLRNKP